MTTQRTVLLGLALAEIAHLTDLLEQFAELVGEGADDPAVQRLTPDAYPDDAAATDEFRRLTSGDLLRRRTADAAVVLASLRVDGQRVDLRSLDEHAAMREVTLVLAPDEAAAWLRTLSATRLVLASRLGIAGEDHEPDPRDPLVGVYEWLGFRLETLIRALDE